MKKTFDQTQLGLQCIVCGKRAVVGMHKPHSQKRTKRLIKPNIQSYFGVTLCTRCLRSAKAKKAAETESISTG